MALLCPLLEESRRTSSISHVVFTKLEAARTPSVRGVYSDFTTSNLPTRLVRWTSFQLSHLLSPYHKPIVELATMAYSFNPNIQGTNGEGVGVQGSP